MTAIRNSPSIPRRPNTHGSSFGSSVPFGFATSPSTWSPKCAQVRCSLSPPSIIVPHILFFAEISQYETVEKVEGAEAEEASSEAAPPPPDNDHTHTHSSSPDESPSEPSASSSSSHSLSSHPRDHCDHCGNGGSLKRCARCKSVWYCSRECQKNGWSTHKLVCQQ